MSSAAEITKNVLKVAIPAGALFILLSPGLLINIPPVDGQWFLSGKTSIWSIMIQALVFTVIMIFLAHYVVKSTHKKTTQTTHASTTFPPAKTE